MGEAHFGAFEERRGERQRPGPRLRRVEAERAEDVPGRERPEVVVAGVAGRGRAVEAEPAADRRLRLPRPAQPVVEPGRLQGRLVAEQGVVGVGPSRAGVEDAEEGVESRRRLGRPAHPVDESGRVLRDHPGVLRGVALDEAATLKWVIWIGEGAAREARLDQAARRVEEVAPVGGAGDELAHRSSRLPGPPRRELGDREVVDRVLERRRRRAPDRGRAAVDRVGVADVGVFVEGDVAVFEVAGEALALDVFTVRALARFARPTDHRGERRGAVEVVGAEGRGGGDHRVGRVADHRHRLAVGVGPARQAARLFGVGDERLDHVGGAARLDQGEQRDLGAVDVPAGEVGVLGAAAGLVDGAVHADVVAADVVEGPRREQRVVERGVEGADVAGGAAADADFAERLVPALPRRGADRAEAVARAFGAERGAGAGDRDEGDADADRHGAVAAGVEGRVGAGARGHLRVPGRALGVGGGFAPRFKLPFGPGPRGGEGAGEAGGEVDLVARALAAEEAAPGAAADFAGAGVDLDRGFVVGLGRPAGVDQDARVRARREGEAAEAGAGGRGQRDADRAAPLRLQLDRVEAGRAALGLVREARLELPRQSRPRPRRGRSAQRFGGRDEGEVAVDGAARAAQVGEAEAGDVVVAVVVAARVRRRRGRVGAPLDHPEGQRRPRVVVAAAEGVRPGPGPGEDVDLRRRVSGRAGDRDQPERGGQGEDVSDVPRNVPSHAAEEGNLGGAGPDRRGRRPGDRIRGR